MHTRRPLLIFVILGLLGALLFSGTAAAETQPAPTPEPPANPEPTPEPPANPDSPAPQPTPDPDPGPATVLVCNLWDGEPYDYWKAKEMSAADADWWVANSANATIVEGSGACPGNAPVSLCIPDGDADKLIVVEPWDANWYLANVAGAKKAVNGSCEEVVPEPTPDPEPTPEPEPTTDPKPEPTTDPKPEPTTDPKPEPTTDPEPEPEPTPDGDVDSSGGNAGGGDDDTTTEVLGIAQEREELAVTGVESWHLALAGMTMLSMGILINIMRRRFTPAEVVAHARR